MKWKCDNGVYYILFEDSEINKLKKGGVYTLKTKKDELIVIKRK